MHRRLFLGIGLFALLFSVLAPGAGAQELRLATGPIGGSWYPLGGAIAELMKQKAGVNVTVSPGGGVANVLAIEVGIADLGFGNTASTVDGVMGRDPFKSKTANTRYVSTLYRQFFQIVVREDSGIKTVADLKAKSIAPGPRGFTGEQIARHVLQVYGLSYNDMSKVHHISWSSRRRAGVSAWHFRSPRWSSCSTPTPDPICRQRLGTGASRSKRSSTRRS
jgi:TRAP transporter TAXI family solute receptor